jgi:hypothetical protein
MKGIAMKFNTEGMTDSQIKVLYLALSEYATRREPSRGLTGLHPELAAEYRLMAAYAADMAVGITLPKREPFPLSVACDPIMKGTNQ